MRETPDEITELKNREVFVFGSNKLGRNGAGAARFAVIKFGAKNGIGFGFNGMKTFAIPTKDENIETMPLEEIAKYVERFVSVARMYKGFTFYVTKIGCGLAGLTPEQIGPMFFKALDLENVYLPREFWIEIFKIIGGKHD